VLFKKLDFCGSLERTNGIHFYFCLPVLHMKHIYRWKLHSEQVCIQKRRNDTMLYFGDTKYQKLRNSSKDEAWILQVLRTIGTHALCSCVMQTIKKYFPLKNPFLLCSDSYSTFILCVLTAGTSPYDLLVWSIAFVESGQPFYFHTTLCCRNAEVCKSRTISKEDWSVTG
jgi:hypothetical protein